MEKSDNLPASRGNKKDGRDFKHRGQHVPVDTKSAKRDLDIMAALYIENNPMVKIGNKVSEMEVRFGTNRFSGKPTSKADYDNAIRQLQSGGFKSNNPDGIHYLRIQSEYSPTKNGEMKMSRTRAEIPGLDLIQEYCRTNSIQRLLDMVSTISADANKIKFTTKSSLNIAKDTDGVDAFIPLRQVDFADFNFRVSYMIEEDFDVQTTDAQKIIKSWNNSRKTYRLINRVQFSHPVYPILADISIIKSSSKIDNVPVPKHTVQEAGLLEAPETYEIELEIDNSRVGLGTEYNTSELLLSALRKVIRIVLSGIQQSNYPISFSEKDNVLREYMSLIATDDIRKDMRVSSRYFIGPSPITLQIDNIVPVTEENTTPNIREGYTVTDKTDGERRMLFISNTGRIYMIDSTMNVIFSGGITDDNKLHLSLLDGEFVKYNKSNISINLYAAFDIYYINNKSVRELPLVPGIKDGVATTARLSLLSEYISKMKIKSIVDSKDTNDPSNPCSFRVQPKRFYDNSSGKDIFDGCGQIMRDISAGIYEYNTDGLVFTPSHIGVGGEREGHAGPKIKSTWKHAFKWKPPAFNTIDFLVSIQKNKKGQDDISNIFIPGLNLDGMNNMVQFKTLILRCGFNPKTHKFVNAFLDVINDNITYSNGIDDEDMYLPVPFYPSNPYDSSAHLCNVALTYGGSGNMFLATEEGEYFEEDMIVEFKYDLDDVSKTGPWRWIPIRVRHDKTSELRSGIKNYGNAYHVADGNWSSIHNPITNTMISTGEGIPTIFEKTDVYYNNQERNRNSSPLRQFHNYMKRKLILAVSQNNDTLIDFTVGKGGDLNKWIEARLKFVFGIDVSRDNIQNNISGACSRYLSARKTHKNMPRALFVTGNSSSNIRNGDAFDTSMPKNKEIAQAVFGQGKKDQDALGLGVYAQYGVAKDGFNISSIQFSIHYFFNNNITLNQFLRNVSECTKVGGYFIGTCYDGETVFQKLKSKNEGDSISIVRDGTKMYEITKRYSQDGFPDNENSLGYGIDVFMESINNTYREYLVNFKYLSRLLENYGFVIISDEEAQALGFPQGSGMFENIFNTIEADIKASSRSIAEHRNAIHMTLDDKTISFLNRYFIFRKARSVDTDIVFKVLPTSNWETTQIQSQEEDRIDIDGKGDIELAPIPSKPVSRKLPVRKLVIREKSEIPTPVIKAPTIKKKVKLVISDK